MQKESKDGLSAVTYVLAGKTRHGCAEPLRKCLHVWKIIIAVLGRLMVAYTAKSGAVTFFLKWGQWLHGIVLSRLQDGPRPGAGQALRPRASAV